MKLRAFLALATLLSVAACANEAAKGDRNTGTALENGTPIQETATPPVTVDTATGPASTTTDSSVNQTTEAPEAVDSAAAAQAPTDSSAAPTAQP
jgi:hypothetical protein